MYVLHSLNPDSDLQKSQEGGGMAILVKKGDGKKGGCLRREGRQIYHPTNVRIHENNTFL